MDDQRFDRMEKHLDKLGDKVDDLTKVVTDLARMEEVEKVSTKRGVIYHLVDKGFWLLVGGGITYIIKVSVTAP